MNPIIMTNKYNGPPIMVQLYALVNIDGSTKLCDIDWVC